MKNMTWIEFCEIVEKDKVYQKLFSDHNVNHDPFPRFYKILKYLLKRKYIMNKSATAESLIDFGCHNTQFMSLAKTILGFEVSGVDDWSENAELLFESKYYQLDIGEKWSKIENIKYDYLSAFELIEHIIDTDNFLLQSKNQLKDGGLILISTPNINSLRNRTLVPFGKYPTGLEYRNIIHHVRLYNPTVLESHLRTHGFEVIYKTGVNFLPHKISSFFPKLDNFLAENFTSLCNNFIMVAQKV